MRALVVVPTYDEAENIADLLRAIRASVPEADVMVIDDASPDGTADLAEQVGSDLGQVKVLRRPGKNGLGNAYRDGFGVGLADGYEVLVTLDADFSHDPAAIGGFIDRIESGADLVIGSRYVPGGSTPNWPLHRRLLSRYGNRYTCWILGLPVRDATSGFRAYRGDALRRIRYDTTVTNGYTFMTELAFRLADLGTRIEEVPITFRDRVRGTSKMSALIIAESMLRVTWWGLKLRLGRVRGRAAGSRG